MVRDELRALRQTLGSLHAIDESQLPDQDVVRDAWAAKNQMDALLAKVCAAFDESGLWQESRAKSAAAWISTTTRQPIGLARVFVRQGKKLKKMTSVAQAYADGEIGADHVGLFCRVHNRSTESAFEIDEKALLETATHSQFRHFKRHLGYWYAGVDPDRDERSFREETERRMMHVSKVLDMVYGDFRLDPIGGEIFDNAIRPLEQELFEADWAEARERLGEKATANDLRRSSSQRLADALVEMARRCMAMPQGARRPEPLFTVLVGYETFHGPICELLGGAVLPPAVVTDWIDQAWVERIVFEAPSRVIDVGEQRRIFAGATKRAIQIRDRECYQPTCEEPIGRCQVDHIIPFAAGGPTIIDNGRLACGFHNRDRHKRDGPGP